MKICILSDTFAPSVGGIETFASGIANSLSNDERIEKVSVIAFANTQLRKEIIDKKLDILILPQTNLLRKGLKILHYVIKKKNIDVFHSITTFPTGFFVADYNRYFLHKKFVTMVHGLTVLSAFRRKSLRFPINQTFNNADKIIFNSIFTKNEVKRLYGLKENKLKTIYPGISVPKVYPKEVTALREKYGLSNDDFVVLFVGRLVTRKCVDDLIHAIHKVREEQIRLIIVGDGPEKGHLLGLRNKLNLKRSVIFAGNVQSVFPFYKIAHVFCMPSKYIKEKGDVEGLGLVFLEAQSYGVPVIGTRSGGIPETIDDNKSGFIVPENSPDSIKEKILELMNNERLRNRMGRHAIRFVKNKFSWNKCVAEHIKLYTE